MAVDIITELGRIGLWIQAVGLVVILWIIIEAITIFFNRKRRLLLESIEKRLLRVEHKIDQIAKNKK